jgi:hypothetical protein
MWVAWHRRWSGAGGPVFLLAPVANAATANVSVRDGGVRGGSTSVADDIAWDARMRVADYTARDVHIRDVRGPDDTLRNNRSAYDAARDATHGRPQPRTPSSTYQLNSPRIQ